LFRIAGFTLLRTFFVVFVLFMGLSAFLLNGIFVFQDEMRYKLIEKQLKSRMFRPSKKINTKTKNNTNKAKTKTKQTNKKQKTKKKSE